MHAASEPRRQELFRRLNLAPGGTAALVRMREQLMDALDHREDLAAVDDDFVHLFTSWFNRGFLVLRHIDWSTPAIVLEKIIRYEAVHAIRDWEDLRRRIDPPDRRCYAFFHPALVDEPLIFVEVALAREIPGAIAPILATGREIVEPDKMRTAVFYSISNCQRGLAGVSFGNFLIKQVVEDINREMPKLATFVTLSPVTNFADWLKRERANEASTALNASRQGAVRAARRCRIGGATPEKAARLQEPLMRAAAFYFLRARSPRGLPVDAVARFHLGNGARLERINWLADTSDKAMAQAHGLMVNYQYDLGDIEKNHEAYAEGRTVVASERRAAPAAARRSNWFRSPARTHSRLPVHRHDRPAGDAVLRRRQKHDRRRDLFDLRPAIEIRLRHRRAVCRRVHDRRRHRVDQDAVFGHFLGQRLGERGNAGLGDRIGASCRRPGAAPAPAVPRH